MDLLPIPNTNEAEESVFWGELSPCDHLLHVYSDDESFIEGLHQFVWAGLQNDEAVVVVATEPHLAALDAQISAGGGDPQKARDEGSILAVEANEALSHFMVNDWPDDQKFSSYISSILEGARLRNRSVRVFGEMVAVLWEKQMYPATIRLEHLWNNLCASENFSLYCAYPKAGLLMGADDSIAEICQAHSRLHVT